MTGAGLLLLALSVLLLALLARPATACTCMIVSTSVVHGDWMDQFYLISPRLRWLTQRRKKNTQKKVTMGASQDGNAVVTYAADSHTLYGFLQHWPRATHPANATREIFDWDSHVYLGEIQEANTTYNVLGNVNEYGLAITESTWGGIPELAHQEGAVVDYGSLIYIALQVI
jgi:hypothetical protein